LVNSIVNLPLERLGHPALATKEAGELVKGASVPLSANTPVTVLLVVPAPPGMVKVTELIGLAFKPRDLRLMEVW
jgi:hypothetical protein